MAKTFDDLLKDAQYKRIWYTRVMCVLLLLCIAGVGVCGFLLEKRAEDGFQRTIDQKNKIISQCKKY